jgi:hypothetical protein
MLQAAMSWLNVRNVLHFNEFHVPLILCEHLDSTMPMQLPVTSNAAHGGHRRLQATLTHTTHCQSFLLSC